eukprot:12928946-Prorocentrum_lima.AAC.1
MGMRSGLWAMPVQLHFLIAPWSVLAFPLCCSLLHSLHSLPVRKLGGAGPGLASSRYLGFAGPSVCPRSSYPGAMHWPLPFAIDDTPVHLLRLRLLRHEQLLHHALLRGQFRL